MGTHYSLAQNPSRLYNWAMDTAELLIKQFKALEETPVLCYTGMSGIASATALEVALYAIDPDFKFEMAYVRKKNESSHSHQDVEVSWIERFEDPSDARYRAIENKYTGVFVDDFVDSGVTQRRVRKMTELFGVSWKPPSTEVLSGQSS